MRDHDKRCPLWAKAGMCEQDEPGGELDELVTAMSDTCALSCFKARPPPPNPPPSPPSLPPSVPPPPSLPPSPPPSPPYHPPNFGSMLLWACGGSAILLACLPSTRKRGLQMGMDLIERKGLLLGGGGGPLSAPVPPSALDEEETRDVKGKQGVRAVSGDVAMATIEVEEVFD